MMPPGNFEPLPSSLLTAACLHHRTSVFSDCGIFYSDVEPTEDFAGELFGKGQKLCSGPSSVESGKTEEPLTKEPPSYAPGFSHCSRE
jgi:hypothetical protein